MKCHTVGSYGGLRVYGAIIVLEGVPCADQGTTSEMLREFCQIAVGNVDTSRVSLGGRLAEHLVVWGTVTKHRAGPALAIGLRLQTTLWLHVINMILQWYYRGQTLVWTFELGASWGFWTARQASPKGLGKSSFRRQSWHRRPSRRGRCSVLSTTNV